MPCTHCGEENCKKHTALLASKNTRTMTEFSGSSPPEIFVGKWNYPNVYAGILSPPEYGNTALLSSSEHWHEQSLAIPEILNLRNQLIYTRVSTNVHEPKETAIAVMQEVAMTHNPIAAEFKLQKPITQNTEHDSHVPLIANAAPLASVRLEENPAVKPKVDYLVSDTTVKAKTALLELEKSHIPTSSLVKLLSAGLLGKKNTRKLVPTRWSITAVDDTLSKEKLKQIRYFPEIKDIAVFHAEYLGNHYEFLLLPDKFAFEVIEFGMTSAGFWQDYESFEGRTNYAESVTGAYYANRLALTEYLEKMKRQALCLVLREIRPEYNTPLGVGILRQISREAFSTHPETFATIKEALSCMQTRLHTSIARFTEKSFLLQEFGKQSRLNKFF
jgi:hypothetical protein